MNNPKTIIGLEVHVQLGTQSKLFCGCSTKDGEPNSRTCPVCLGLPGSKPVLNEKAITLATKIALALNCAINSSFYFSRKTYYYPDLAKNYQITQFEVPLAENGHLSLAEKEITIRRIHVEEDPAALIHDPQGFSLIDYNRSGIPLVEIVTEPVIESAAQAREFLQTLSQILDYLDIGGDQTELSMKCDANISLEGHARVEVKNITSFRGVERALQFEETRMRNLLQVQKPIDRETRGFDDEKGTTRTLRSKEEEADYGYIFDPDLPSVTLSESQIAAIKASMPKELPQQKAERFTQQYHLPSEQSLTLVSEKALGELFESLVQSHISPKWAGLFLTRELKAVLNYDALSLRQVPQANQENLKPLLQLLQDQKITEKTAKEALIQLVQKNTSPNEWITSQGLLMDLSADAASAIVDKVLQENPSAVSDYKSGSQKSFNFLLGLVMRESKGKADPRACQKLLEEKLKQ